MAYGSSELDRAAATIDKWINTGTNAIDLFSTHDPLMAILNENSQEPGGEYQMQQSDVAEGNQFKVPVWGKGDATVAGVTRANQAVAIAPTIGGPLTNALWAWSHYQGMIFDNYEDRVKNSGSSQMVDLSQVLMAQIRATFFDTVGSHLWDGTAGAIDHIQSVNACLLNTGTVGGIDQSDSLNAFWQAQQDTTAEAFNTSTFDQVRDGCTFDTGLPTGIKQIDPDVAFLYTNLYSSLRQQLKPAQRTEVNATLKGGAKYLMYDGVRCYRNPRQTANTVVILNSRTMTFRFKTKSPDPVSPGFLPKSGYPSMFERGYNWFVGFGFLSIKHNGLLTNKTA